MRFRRLAEAVGMVDALRLPVYLAMLGLVLAELLLSYNAVERLLYLIPANRDNQEELHRKL